MDPIYFLFLSPGKKKQNNPPKSLPRILPDFFTKKEKEKTPPPSLVYAYKKNILK
jgi:hypothetical protein